MWVFDADWQTQEMNNNILLYQKLFNSYLIASWKYYKQMKEYSQTQVLTVFYRGLENTEQFVQFD